MTPLPTISEIEALSPSDFTHLRRVVMQVHLNRVRSRIARKEGSVADILSRMTVGSAVIFNWNESSRFSTSDKRRARLYTNDPLADWSARKCRAGVMITRVS